MLRLETKWLVISGLLFIVAVTSWITLSRLEHYKALSAEQAQTILNQQHINQQLIGKIHQEREAVQQQNALEQAERTKANDDTTAIRKGLSAQDCAAVALPADVIKRLQQ